MLKRLLTVLLGYMLLSVFLPAAAAETPDEEHWLFISEENFPDAEFRNYLLNTFPHRIDTDEESDDPIGDPYMTKAQVENVKSMDFEGVRDFKGLERFTELTDLKYGDENDCAGAPHAVRNFDLHANTKLQSLRLYRMQCGAIDLSALTDLRWLELDLVPLESLDLSANTALEYIRINKIGLTALDLSAQSMLKTLNLCEFSGTALDLTHNIRLTQLYLEGGDIETVDVGSCTLLKNLSSNWTPIVELDLSANTKLETLQLDGCRIRELDLRDNEKLNRLVAEESALECVRIGSKERLTEVVLGENALRELEIGECPNLTYLHVPGNRLTELDLSGCPNASLEASGQVRLIDGAFAETGNGFAFDMNTLVSDPSRVSFSDGTLLYDPSTGILTAPQPKNEIRYRYQTGVGEMDVKICFPFTGTGTVGFDREQVLFMNDRTPYALYNNGIEQEPAVVVTDENGETVDPVHYTLTYRNNREPGTAKVTAAFPETGKTASAWFKIYLPATEATTAANTQDGVLVTWEPVGGAAGYVIYRRAWNLKDGKWTAFARWNNTTATSFMDTKVYAGTRYQYGIKAYFASKTDPETGKTVGGAFDAYNLGVVGPLKTTVRITTRTIRSVTAGVGKMTVKWDASGVFTGYQLYYAYDRAFKQIAGIVKIDNPKTAAKTVGGLDSGVTYYVKVRSYHIFEGMTYFGQWSETVSCKIG